MKMEHEILEKGKGKTEASHEKLEIDISKEGD
jgi:hypothetical protein